MSHRRLLPKPIALIAVGALVLGSAAPVAAASPGIAHGRGSGPLAQFKHIVVIYEENHSFDNLYGLWGAVGRQKVDGLGSAGAAHTTQVSQAGDPYTCLKQVDVNLNTDFAGSATPAFPANTLSVQPACNPETVTFPDGSTTTYTSHFANAPFAIDDYIPAGATTCPRPNQEFRFGNEIRDGALDPATGETYGMSGGCTRDLVHKFYQEQYQLDGGRQDRYVTGSDAVGLTMGHYDTTQLPIYRYLHARGAPRYVIADRFFQAAYGGSYLNHQYLIGAQPLLWAGAPAATHAVLDPSGIAHAYPLLKPATGVVDGAVTQACGTPTTVAGLACGDWAVNTLQPPYEPQGSFGAVQPATDDSTKDLNIGDRLSDAGVSWAWYSGGWDNAAGNVGGSGWTNGSTPGTCTDPNASASDAQYPYCPDSSFQFHHQPFNYFTRYAPGTPDRAAHLRDEVEFLAAAKNGHLPAVSFVKPLGRENEHPGYASEPNGSDHLVDLIQAVENGPQAGSTLIVVTYDEFGGAWDHVSPPGLGTNGAHDAFGPGTRIPALLIAKRFSRSGVDHTVYDTTSIMATIEHRFGLKPVDAAGSVVPRDRLVPDLRHAVLDGRRAHHR